MLIKCPECDLQISDKAYSCPHCGYPLKPSLQPQGVKRSNRRRRLPNGFGQISFLKNRNLRKPYRAMVTVGKTEYGKPICRLLKPEAYFETYNEAYAALLEYNRDPYILETKTLEDLYNLWSEDFYSDLSDSSISKYKQCWRYCQIIKHMPVREIRVRHIRQCIDQATAPQTKKTVKTLFNLMLDKAVEYEMTDRNYSRLFQLEKNITKAANTTAHKHIPFTDEEMDTMWKYVNIIPEVRLVLIQCYSGWRPQELVNIKKEDVDLVNWTFKGGSKSEAGRNRVVPIHSRIRDLVEQYYESNEEYLFGRMDYTKYRKIFERVVFHLRLSSDHRPHDGRAHFITQCKKYNVDEYAIKYMVGHAIRDITEDVYTTREISWLAHEVEKIK